MSKVVLISPPNHMVNNDRLDPPLGLMYLSNYLKCHGHDTTILDYSGSNEHIIPPADIYGFSTYTPTYRWSADKAAEIRDTYPNAKYVCGGAHVSAIPEDLDGWDHICVGEGEECILSIANGNRLPCIIYGDPVNINDIPFPDYDAIDINTYDRLLDGHKLLSIFTSRGCPYHCAFCNSIIWNRQAVRFRTPSSIGDELSFLISRYGIKYYRIVDDIFAISYSRVNELAKVFREHDIVYRCTGRCNTFNKDIAASLVDSGCIQVEFGVESASNLVLKMMRKKQTQANIINAIHTAKEYGLKVRIYLIVGFPGETWDTIRETCDVILDVLPDEVLVHTPIPFPGTALYNTPEEFGINYIDNDFSKYMQISKDMNSYVVISHNTASSDEIRAMWEYAVDRLRPIQWYGGYE